MNCKPGDLAMIVRSDGWGKYGEIAKLLFGRIVRVVDLGPPANPSTCHSDIVWRFETPLKVQFEGKQYVANGIHDSCLKPIRPNAIDVQDESKAWLPPVPTKEHA